MVIGVFDFFFFFQAEDGIRDSSVTGVQTCALPISMIICRRLMKIRPRHCPSRAFSMSEHYLAVDPWPASVRRGRRLVQKEKRRGQIGRASCRERVEISVGAVSLKKKKK